MSCPAIEINPLDPVIRTSLHPPFVEIFDAERCVFQDTLDAGDVPEEGCGGECESKLAKYLYILLDATSIQWTSPAMEPQVAGMSVIRKEKVNDRKTLYRIPEAAQTWY